MVKALKKNNKKFVYYNFCFYLCKRKTKYFKNIRFL
jgi:hypothetical protein